MNYLVCTNEAAWLELIRRVNHHLGYPNPTTKTDRYNFKWTHTDGRRCLVWEDGVDLSGCLSGGEIAATVTSAPSGFSASTTSPAGEFPYTASVAIACEGDSIITGDYNLDGGVGWLAESEKFYSQLMVALGSPANVTAVNLGLGGSKFADLTSRKAANIDNLNWPTGCEKVLMLMVGTNDIHHDGTSPTTVYANLKALIASYKASTPGLQVFVMTSIARSTSTTNQMAYRDLVVAGHASGDLGTAGVANTGGLSQFNAVGDVTNGTYYVNDQTHPKAAGIVLLAQCAATTLQASLSGV